jgi:hypothetical protein
MNATGMTRALSARILCSAIYGLSILFLLSSWVPIRGFGTPSSPSISGCEQEKLNIVLVPGNIPWTDTGLDVVSGQEILFEAEGNISLQRGNPEAECGPDGYDLRTVQQPMPDRNMGALIGKVVVSVIVTVNEKTKEQKKEEVAELFFVGSKNRVEMPAKGRLYLGINENVIGDNAGEYRAKIYLGRGSGPASLPD